MRYMLDANIISDLLRNPRGRVAWRVPSVGEDPLRRAPHSPLPACGERPGEGLGMGGVGAPSGALLKRA